MRASLRSSWVLWCVIIFSVVLSACASSPEKTRGGNRLTGRDFLIANQPEAAGYGLYSYVLLEPVNTGNRKLNEAVLAAYLKIEEVGRFEEAGVPRKEININYLPLRKSPPDNPSVGWLLDHYDFTRAQIIKRAAGLDGGGGPHIISHAAALSNAQSVDKQRLLLQDLSGVPPDLAFLWMREFLMQAQRPRYWDKRAMQGFMVSLRTHIAIVARAFSETRDAQSDVAKFMESKISMSE